MKFWVPLFRIITGTVNKFIKDECFYKASCLTFYSLLSIVPILAVAFGIAKGLGLEKYLSLEVQSRFLEQPQLADQIISFAYSLLDRTHGGVIAIFGVIGFLWTSIQLFNTMEHTFNEILEVREDRSYFKQASDYLLMLLIGPLFLVTASIVSFLSVRYLDKISLKLFPFIIIWALFFLIYIFVPNTKINWKYALLGAVLAGTIYKIMEWIYIYFQIGVANYGAIYGSFAALPLFLVWVNTSWCIVLLGLELATELERPHRSPLKNLTKKQLAFRIIIKSAEEPSPSVRGVAYDLGVSERLIESMVILLQREGFILEKKDHTLMLVKKPEEYKIQELMEQLENLFMEKYPVLSKANQSLEIKDCETLQDLIANSKNI